MLILTVLQGPEKGRRFELPSNEPQQIGRSGEALPLTDRTISRRHAELTPDDGQWYIRDLKSANGTFVNGVRVIDRWLLKPGDQIRTGTSLMLFGIDAKEPNASALRIADKGEIDVNVERTVASSDESMIMSVPDPAVAAEFQLKVIYELTALIGSITDRQELLEKIMDIIFGYFEADRGFILLQEGDQQDSTPAVVRHKLPDITPKDARITVSKTIVRYVTRKGVGVLSANAMSDTRFATGDSVQNLGIRSAMCVPIKFKDRIYGVIHVDSMIHNYTYTEDQLTLLTTIGVHTGLAMANAHLHDERLRSERLAAVGQTVASLSHSIKNILQGMRGGADVVELGLRKNNMKVLHNGWEIVVRNQHRIYELAMNMLAYSKQRKPDIVMANLPEVLNEIIALTQAQFDAKNVALLADFDAELPPVPIDLGGIHQAVLNLVNNALDAVEPESGVVSLHCDVDESSEYVHIRVADNGIGMSPQTRQRLFEPFHSTKGLRGTGLGLVVAKKVVDEHGGRIEVESAKGQGTTFVMHLPVHVEALPASADTQHPT